jgi:hypothetical protein
MIILVGSGVHRTSPRRKTLDGFLFAHLSAYRIANRLRMVSCFRAHPSVPMLRRPRHWRARRFDNKGHAKGFGLHAGRPVARSLQVRHAWDQGIWKDSAAHAVRDVHIF